MIGYEVEIVGLNEQIRNLEGFNQVAQAEFTPAMGQSMALIVRGAKMRAKVGATGELRSKIGYEVKTLTDGSVVGIVRASAQHAASVEMGSRAHFPPVDRIAYWVYRVLGVGGGQGIGVAIQIARKIGHRGTRAQPYLRPAFEAARGGIERMMGKAVDRIAQRLATGGR